MKIEINHPKNISLPPPQKSFKSPEQTQHHGNNPNPLPSEKIPKLPKACISSTQKKFKPSRENLNFTEKFPFPKNSINITEIISNTRTKSQPLPEKSQPLVKNSQSLLKKSQPPTP